MDFLRFLGFAIVALAVVVGLDYYQQDKKHEETLTLEGYFDTVASRFNLYQEERLAEEVEQDRQKRWRQGAKPYLPPSSEEWVRRAITDHDYTVDARLGAEQAKASAAARPLAIEVAVQEAKVRADKLDRIGWLYENGEKTIWLQARLVSSPNQNTIVGNIEASLAGMNFKGTDYAALGVIGGVAYFEEVAGDFYDVSKGTRTNWALMKKKIAETGKQVSFKTYVGTLGLGQEIRLKVMSDAPRDEVYAFLQQVDYDGLNALLSLPVPGVSNDRVIDKAVEPELAVDMAKLRTEFVKLRGELAQMRINNLDNLSLVANTLAGSYGLPGDTFDLTANKISSPQELMQLGYRKGLNDLMYDQPDLASTNQEQGMFGRLFAKVTGGSAEQADPTQQPVPTQASSGGGLLSGLTSIFNGSGSRSQSAEVKVRKGSLDTKSCSMWGANKRCAVGN